MGAVTVVVGGGGAGPPTLGSGVGVRLLNLSNFARILLRIGVGLQCSDDKVRRVHGRQGQD